MKVNKDDFMKGKEKTIFLKKGNIPEGLYLWFNINKLINLV
jgi:hypothetical protein